jgi:hypothetical protein
MAAILLDGSPSAACGTAGSANLDSVARKSRTTAPAVARRQNILAGCYVQAFDVATHAPVTSYLRKNLWVATFLGKK